MRIKVGILGFLALFGSSSTFAQVTGDNCERLAQTIAVGYTVTFSERQYDAMRYYANCEANESSAGAGLNVVYGAFGLGAKYDQAKRSNVCTKTLDSQNIKTADYNNTKNIFIESLDTINKCIDAAKRRWNIDYRQVLRDNVTLTLSHGGPTGGRLLGVDVLPPNSLKCSTTPPQLTFPVTVTSTDVVTMTCTRTPTKVEIDDISVTSASDAVLNLRLADSPFEIKIAGYTSSVVDTLNKKIDAARGELMGGLTDLREKLSQWNNAAAANGNPTTAGGGTSTCPPGHYVAAVNWVGAAPNVRYCVGCLTAMTVVCRKLNIQ